MSAPQKAGLSLFSFRRLKGAAAGTAALALAAVAAPMPTATFAAPPAEGSEQMIMMTPYRDFVKHMRTPAGGSCCDLGDGRADMKEEIRIGADGKPHYFVFVTRKAFGEGYHGLIPEEGRWIEIPDRAVLTSEYARKVCDDLKQANPEAGKTCNPPPFNILWMSASGHVYCYWPEPKFTHNLKPTSIEVKLAGLHP